MAIKDKRKKAEYDRRYREVNQEKIAEYKRRYREVNKEKVAEYKRRYREVNKEQVAESNRRYREVNKEKIAEYNRRYRKKLIQRLNDSYIKALICHNCSLKLGDVPNELVITYRMLVESKRFIRRKKHEQDYEHERVA